MPKITQLFTSNFNEAKYNARRTNLMKGYKCKAKGCALVFLNRSTRKVHFAAEHGRFATPGSNYSSESLHVPPVNEQGEEDVNSEAGERQDEPKLFCPIGCGAHFSKYFQVSRHKWQHIPREHRPHCTGLKGGQPCDYLYSGRADVMKSHWRVYHAEHEGPYPAPKWESFEELCIRLKIKHSCRDLASRPSPQPSPPPPAPSIRPSTPMPTTTFSSQPTPTQPTAAEAQFDPWLAFASLASQSTAEESDIAAGLSGDYNMELTSDFTLATWGL